MQTTRGRFIVGDYIVEPRLNRITGPQEISVVEPKVMHVLLCMADQPGEVLTKDRLIEEVWEDTVVTDYVVSRSISQLRKIFDDSFRAPRYIETVSKTGYRLIAPVSGNEAGSIADAIQPHGDSHPELEIDIVPGNHTAPDRVDALPPRRRLRTIAGSSIATALILAWIGGSFFVNRPAQPQPSTLFTSSVGIEMNPVFSPDGSMIAFLRYDSDYRYDLYVKMIGAQTELRLTDHPASDISPSWSPDGRHLMFQRISMDSCAVYRISALGGAERKLMDCGPAQRNLSGSPDGSFFLSAEAVDDARGLHIVSVDAATSERTALTSPPPAYSDFFPSISPDGRWIAFCRGPQSAISDLYIMPAEGGSPRRLTHDDRNIARYTWAPDGRTILFSSNRTGDYRLWTVDVRSGEVAWVSGIATLDPGGPALSPDGRHLAFEEWIYEINIWESTIAGADAQATADSTKHLTRRFSSTRWDFQPHVSPDGEHVAFVSNRSGHPELWVGARDGSEASSLVSFGGAYVRRPRWSPDGNRIAFEAYIDGRSAIYVVESRGGRPKLVSTVSFESRAPDWSADGQWIYFASNREDDWQIWKMPAEGGAPVRVTRNGGYLAQASPDGQTLYYSKLDEGGLWRLGAAGQEELVVAGLLPVDWGNWAVTARGIYLFERQRANVSLVRYDLTGSEAESIASFSVNSLSHESGIAVSPDDASVLFPRVDRSESDIVLAEFQYDR